MTRSKFSVWLLRGITPAMIAKYLCDQVFSRKPYLDVIGLLLFCGLLLLLPWALFLWRKPKGLAKLTLGLTVLVLDLAACTVVSLLYYQKTLAIDEKIPPEVTVASRISAAGRDGIRRTEDNRIDLTSPPIVTRDARGDLQMLLDIQWRKRKWVLCVPNRLYGARVLLTARARREHDGTTVMDPSELKDYSAWPIQDWAYLFGWLEIPALASESGLVTKWVDVQVKEPSAAEAVAITRPAAESPHAEATP